MEINKPIAAIILLVINFIVLFLFDVPKFRESSDLQTTLAVRQAKYNSENEYYDKLAMLLKDIKTRKDALTKIDSALPAEVSFSQLAYFLETKELENGLLSKSVSFSQSAPSGPSNAPSVPTGSPGESSVKKVKTISFTVDVVGSYDGMKNFLYTLEKSSRLFEVDTIDFSSLARPQSPKQNQLSSYNFKLLVKTNTY